MSLQQAAKHLERHGRNGDDMLVHMSKGEVKSLNDIAMAHGGHLTINPHTGLPEAGFLSKMLPMIAGAGLMAVSGGAINPMTAGLLVGGGTAVASGDIKKGLMAGLGAYGGAGLGSALAQSGMQAAAAPEIAANSAMSHTPLPASIAPEGVSSFGSQGFGSQALQTPALAGQQAAYQTGGAGQNIGTMFQGAKGLGSEAGRASFMGNIGGKMGLAKYGLSAGAPLIAGMLEPQKQTPTPTDSDPGQQYTYSANPTTPFPTPDPSGREQRYFNPVYTPRFADGGMADGGISHLGDYSDGGRLLRGPGDGVSDSIPAVIGQKQPARLADGEFVVPARIVSELGNGSTEAGARKLYAMMDRIQKARGKTVGKGKVAKNSRSEKYLPA